MSESSQSITVEQYLEMSEQDRSQLPKAKQKKLSKLALKMEQKALKAKVAMNMTTSKSIDNVSKNQEAPNRDPVKLEDDDFEKRDSKHMPPEYVDNTPRGAFKELMAKPMAPAYYPQSVEAAWNDWWDAQGYFSASTKDALSRSKKDETFVMVIPPPNVTGTLHLGHTLMCAIQDCISRWHRMRGHVTLWLPGTDHAGIATQTIVEKKLMRQYSKSRHDFGRSAFVEQVWNYKEEFGGKICDQLRRLGASVDWSREQFTMNERLSRAVTEAFVRLYQQGLIYRGTRLVNWCCRLRTALSDIEVDYVELNGREMRSVPGHEQPVEFGVLTHFAYRLEEPRADDLPEMVVATTRLETMLGDVAVAVHPNDPRYSHLIGRRLVHPFIANRTIEVIGDEQLVEMEFGTGCVKVTPAHDPNDYECGLRHNLPMITVIDDEGRMNANAGEFFGMLRYEARLAVEKALESLGLLRGKESNPMRLATCSRSGDVIEPLLKPQWWVDCKKMADEAISVVKNGEITILPEFHKETWYRWLKNIRDWCISRQLWWGHRIPAWRYTDQQTGMENWVVARNATEARAQVPSDAASTLEQDEDVLDTWFSSGLFPFSVFGWPDTSPSNEEFRAFYPTTLMETGHDILFFWVARMVMLGLTLTNTVPFRTIYLHAIIRDKYGRKMSKSLGNVVDPIEVIKGATLEELHEKLRHGNLDEREVERAIEGQKLDFGPNGIPECGADALRLGLLAYTLQGRDINLDVARVAAYRNFCNKLWNATRFAMQMFDTLNSQTDTMKHENRLHPIEDRWIESRLANCVTACHEALASFSFADAVSALYNFWLYELCDVYLEAIKPRIYRQDGTQESIASAAMACQTLLLCLDNGLRLLHPMMPFVTEELYQRLPIDNRSPSIMIAPYPTHSVRESDVEGKMEEALAIIRSIRSLRAAHHVKNIARPNAVIVGSCKQLAHLVATLAQCGTVKMGDEAPPNASRFAVQVATPNVSVYVDLSGWVDIGSELIKLEQKKAGAQQQARRYLQQLESFDVRVPSNVRQKTSDALERCEQEIQTLNETIEKLQQMHTS